jgi:pimeloyl-ACP methyl ester carboxylesterase
MASPEDGSSVETTPGGAGGRSMVKPGVKAQTGTFLDDFSYVRLGSGTQNLVILPGTTLDNRPPTRFAAWAYRFGFGRFAEDHTVYVINRRRGMPTGYTTQDMAADYARIIEGELGPSHVMGFSTGGEIAQYVAIDHPEAVRSLALIVVASRLSDEGLRMCERWQTLTRENRWQELHADMAASTVTGETNQRLARAFMKVFGRFVLGAPDDPSDFLITLEADLGHDTTDRLPEISAPTLVVGGSEDPFYSESLLRETAAGIPDATLRVYEGVGHGVPKERKRQYESDVLAFLEGSREGSSGARLGTISERTKETG